jgi:hypothetical protein
MLHVDLRPQVVTGAQLREAATVGTLQGPAMLTACAPSSASVTPGLGQRRPGAGPPPGQPRRHGLLPWGPSPTGRKTCPMGCPVKERSTGYSRASEPPAGHQPTRLLSRRSSALGFATGCWSPPPSTRIQQASRPAFARGRASEPSFVRLSFARGDVGEFDKGVAGGFAGVVYARCHFGFHSAALASGMFVSSRDVT